ncbi:Cytochrome c7 [Desulfacinum hydrothermale DSM 13146]|uniref:Cytochrome c7 n=1 Tax=Desulfacinum hydrothermale DSM 13146 TaxID=1121390 RepID=A0A1W1XAD8_9BACT|nr:cytochrome c3 family protein [Desulfacinum hydrothermale]SMC20744.1 Cytochrome c7 [Desulfacinum hydrothermale DSM 13146]
MKWKGFLISCVLFLALVGLWVGIAQSGGTSDAVHQGPETLILNSGPMSPSLVPHWKHQEVVDGCAPCHELFPQQRGSVDALKAEGQLKKKQVMNRCLACHKQKTEAGNRTGPVRCRDCHRKELKASKP